MRYLCANQNAWGHDGMKNEYQNRAGEYEKSYGGSSYNKDERSHYASRKENATPPKARKEETAPPKDAGNVNEEPQGQQDHKKRMKTIYKKLFFAWFFLFILSNVFTWIWNDDSLDEDVQTEETIDYPWLTDDADLDEELQPANDNEDANDVINDGSDSQESESAEIAPKDDDAAAPKDDDAAAPKENEEAVSDDDLSTNGAH